MVIKKGYYVVSNDTLDIASGPDAIPTPEEARERWQDIQRSMQGSDKFFILWNPGDNFAWGE